MTELVKQPTKKPTRKVTAQFISGLIAAAIVGGLGYAFPDSDLKALVEPLALMISPVVGLVSGYMVMERAA